MEQQRKKRKLSIKLSKRSCAEFWLDSSSVRLCTRRLLALLSCEGSSKTLRGALSKNASFTVPIADLVKQYAQGAIASEANFLTRALFVSSEVIKQLRRCPLLGPFPTYRTNYSRKSERFQKWRTVAHYLRPRNHLGQRVGNIESIGTVLVTTERFDRIGNRRHETGGTDE